MGTFDVACADEMAWRFFPPRPSHALGMSRVELGTNEYVKSIVLAIRNEGSRWRVQQESGCGLFELSCDLDLHRIDIATGSCLDVVSDVASILSCHSGVTVTRIDILDVILINDDPTYLLAWREMPKVDASDEMLKFDDEEIVRWHYSIVQGGAVTATLVGGVVTNAVTLSRLIVGGVYVRRSAETLYLRTDLGWRSASLDAIRMPDELFRPVGRDDIPEGDHQKRGQIGLRINWPTAPEM